jgi:iron complex transport system ATP-binding protein
MASLQLDQLTFGRGREPLTTPLALKAESGEIWAVLGENGVGKSTLLATLAGLLEPVGGRVCIDGVDVRRCPRKLLARRVGLLLQQAPMDFPFTVYETVSAGRYAHRPGWAGLGTEDDPLIEQAITVCGLQAHRLLPVDRLSGGEQRRVALATILAQNPGILLLDEPVNHLDLRYQAHLLEELRMLARAQGRLVILTVHDINVAARLADRVLLLYPDGQHEQGATTEMLTEQRLGRVFSHPVQRVGDDTLGLWLPAAKSD